MPENTQQPNQTDPQLILRQSYVTERNSVPALHSNDPSYNPLIEAAKELAAAVESGDKSRIEIAREAFTKAREAAGVTSKSTLAAPSDTPQAMIDELKQYLNQRNLALRRHEEAVLAGSEHAALQAKSDAENWQQHINAVAPPPSGTPKSNPLEELTNFIRAHNTAASLIQHEVQLNQLVMRAAPALENHPEAYRISRLLKHVAKAVDSKEGSSAKLATGNVQQSIGEVSKAFGLPYEPPPRPRTLQDHHITIPRDTANISKMLENDHFTMRVPGTAAGETAQYPLSPEQRAALQAIANARADREAVDAGINKENERFISKMREAWYRLSGQSDKNTEIRNRQATRQHQADDRVSAATQAAKEVFLQEAEKITAKATAYAAPVAPVAEVAPAVAPNATPAQAETAKAPAAEAPAPAPAKTQLIEPNKANIYQDSAHSSGSSTLPTDTPLTPAQQEALNRFRAVQNMPYDQWDEQATRAARREAVERSRSNRRNGEPGPLAQLRQEENSALLRTSQRTWMANQPLDIDLTTPHQAPVNQNNIPTRPAALGPATTQSGTPLPTAPGKPLSPSEQAVVDAYKALAAAQKAGASANEIEALQAAHAAAKQAAMEEYASTRRSSLSTSGGVETVGPAGNTPPAPKPAAPAPATEAKPLLHTHSQPAAVVAAAQTQPSALDLWKQRKAALDELKRLTGNPAAATPQAEIAAAQARLAAAEAQIINHPTAKEEQARIAKAEAAEAEARARSATRKAAIKELTALANQAVVTAIQNNDLDGIALALRQGRNIPTDVGRQVYGYDVPQVSDMGAITPSERLRAAQVAVRFHNSAHAKAMNASDITNFDHLNDKLLVAEQNLAEAKKAVELQTKRMAANAAEAKAANATPPTQPAAQTPAEAPPAAPGKTAAAAAPAQLAPQAAAAPATPAANATAPAPAAPANPSPAAPAQPQPANTAAATAAPTANTSQVAQPPAQPAKPAAAPEAPATEPAAARGASSRTVLARGVALGPVFGGVYQVAAANSTRDLTLAELPDEFGTGFANAILPGATHGFTQLRNPTSNNLDNAANIINTGLQPTAIVSGGLAWATGSKVATVVASGSGVALATISAGMDVAKIAGISDQGGFGSAVGETAWNYVDKHFSREINHLKNRHQKAIDAHIKERLKEPLAEQKARDDFKDLKALPLAKPSPVDEILRLTNTSNLPGEVKTILEIYTKHGEGAVAGRVATLLSQPDIYSNNTKEMADNLLAHSKRIISGAVARPSAEAIATLQQASILLKEAVEGGASPSAERVERRAAAAKPTPAPAAASPSPQDALEGAKARASRGPITLSGESNIVLKPGQSLGAVADSGELQWAREKLRELVPNIKTPTMLSVLSFAMANAADPKAGNINKIQPGQTITLTAAGIADIVKAMKDKHMIDTKGRLTNISGSGDVSEILAPTTPAPAPGKGDKQK